VKIRMVKSGKLFSPADLASHAAYARLEDGMYTCGVTRAKKGKLPDELRRTAQNRLYWTIIHDLARTQVNALAGHNDLFWHTQMKIKFLVPILLRDSERFGMLYATLEEVLRQMGKDVYENLLDGIIAELSTTKLTVKQFAEYLTETMRYCRAEGVFLTVDRELVEMALQAG